MALILQKNMKGKVAQSATYEACKFYFTVVIIVLNPRHFDTDPEPYTGLRIRIRLFWQWLQRCQQNFFSRPSLSLVCLFLTVGSFTLVFKDNMP